MLMDLSATMPSCLDSGESRLHTSWPPCLWQELLTEREALLKHTKDVLAAERGGVDLLKAMIANEKRDALKIQEELDGAPSQLVVGNLHENK
jgi:hypothetical protein